METGDVTEGTEEGTSSEYVELPDATDEDIDAFLEGAEYREQQQQEGYIDEPQQPEQKSEQPKEQPKTQDEPQVQSKDIEAIRKQLEGLELLNKRRTSELAEVKRQLKEFRDRVSQNLDEKWLESPTQAYAQARQVEMAQQKIQEIEAEEASLTNAHQAQVLLAHHVGDGIDVEAIAESLQSDGMPPEFIQSFLSNPYKAALPETLIQLAKRASAEKRIREYESALNEIIPYTQRLLEERKKLPSDVLRNVQTALRQSPQVTGSAGGTGQVRGNSPVEFAAMSDQELQEFLKG